ncbi:MAG: hypothetical protein A3G24_07485 [Betaproteobacteria bacterium RIFCSPLOWO2_12_FULL_62_13]|nr:MAG: hypothetical protein A3G24_07485 [Betaproteobacteria bacterium RIFCSPLOWO2_12_FULL_62_13]
MVRLNRSSAQWWLIAAILLSPLWLHAAESAAPYSGTTTVRTRYGFDTLISRLEKAIADHKMGLVAQASASRGAAARGVKIPGNAVLMVFRNDYAVRMLNASVPAGIEAPLRIYVNEESDGTASIIYRVPSAVFAPYRNKALDEMAKELDVVFQNIVRDAARR